MKYFLKPPLDIYSSVEGDFFQGYKTYAEYNYLRPGITSYIKRKHLELALKKSHKWFYITNAIEIGCADGVFIPSLSKYFTHVVAIDKNPHNIKISQSLVNTCCLNNVELFCNDGLTINEIRAKIAFRKYHVLYLLEVIEHVGDKANFYGSKISFLKEISTLIEREEGIIVMTMPKMVGIPFLIQRIGLTLLGLHREPISMKNFFKAVFLNNADGLESLWEPQKHIGFNHLILEKCLKKEFSILEKKDLLFQIMYVLK